MGRWERKVTSPKINQVLLKIQSFQQKLERKYLDKDGTSLTHRILYIVTGEMQLQNELEEIKPCTCHKQVENEGSVAVVIAKKVLAQQEHQKQLLKVLLTKLLMEM